MSRGLAVVVTTSMVLAALALAGVALGPSTDDADAQSTTPPRTLWADVGSDGFLNGGEDATSAIRTGTGSYEVRFDQVVIGCAHTATLGQSPGEISVGSGAYFTPTAGNQFAGRREVAVFTRDSAGGFADKGFFLVVNC
jgi:hypothetical protein